MTFPLLHKSFMIVVSARRERGKFFLESYTDG